MNLKKIIAGVMAVCSLGVAVPAVSSAPDVNAVGNVLAFPGAVGGGKYATGGRGGEVYHVTNLNDSGAGSFRDAVSKSGRIVVFDVSGTIELKSNILCQSNITIAGQTAPGGSGITLKNYKMGMSGDNIICRYISSRPGPYTATSSGNDAWGGSNGSNSIIDHCSMGWTTDEQWGLYSNNMNYTVQYSVLGPADSWGGHKKGLHGFGMMMGKGNLTFDHNLIIHNVSRNFRGKVEGTNTADFTNNVIYDWGYQTAYGTIGHLNYVNNTLKMGNSTTGGKHYVNVDSSTKPENFKIYIDGNRILNKDNSVYETPTNDNWAGVDVKESIGITKDQLVSDSPFQTLINGENVSSVQDVESAEDSYNHVISYAGNGISPEKRTAIDLQCAEETLNGTGSCSGTASYDDATDANKENIDKYQIQCGVVYEYPSAVLTKEITDSDNDGMPDEWELARGLDPNDASDYKGDYCGQGYMNIEYYINDLTVNSFPEGVVTLSPKTTIVEPVPAKSAFETIEAESYTSQDGIKTEDLSTGGQNIGFIENGDYAVYNKLDFGDGAKSFGGKISGNACAMELYLDNMNGSPVATVNFKGTSGFSDYQDVMFNIPEITDTHNLYIKFTGGDGYLMNADSFIFGKESVSLNGKYFTHASVLESANPNSWEIAENAQVGSLIFGDRDFTIATIPECLKGAEIMKTACDAKSVTQRNTLVFTTGADADIYVGVDTRVEKTPEFLDGWTKTDETFTSSNDVTFVLYKRTFQKMKSVVIGYNGQSANCVNFTLFAQPHTATEQLKGDINSDGKVNVADLVLLNKHILAIDSLTAEQCKTADLAEDGRIDSFDMIELRKLVLN
ncbi:MAG: carbohydrate-binding protein [Ruminococcus flavefaciens]|nr:carbohydrate-binding protein [Ruminococcus flavefaciens]